MNQDQSGATANSARPHSPVQLRPPPSFRKIMPARIVLSAIKLAFSHRAIGQGSTDKNAETEYRRKQRRIMRQPHARRIAQSQGDIQMRPGLEITQRIDRKPAPSGAKRTLANEAAAQAKSTTQSSQYRCENFFTSNRVTLRPANRESLSHEEIVITIYWKPRSSS